MHDLSAPVRVTWDLPPDPVLAAAVWRRLARARVLFVEVRVRPEGLGGLPGLAAGLSTDPGPRLALLGPPDPLLAAIEALGPRALAEAEVEMLPPYRPGTSVEELVAATHRLVPVLWSLPAELDHLEQALEIAAAYRLGAVAVLNPPAPAEPLGRSHRAQAAAVWRRRAAPGLEPRVHDVFLARDFGLDVSGYRGCQGASVLAHVEEDGRVVACRTHPVEVGRLPLGTLEEIWASERRRAVAAALWAVPEDCAGCGVVEACRGGCPGLAPPGERDRSCPGPVCG